MVKYFTTAFTKVYFERVRYKINSNYRPVYTNLLWASDSEKQPTEYRHCHSSHVSSTVIDETGRYT